MVSGKVKECGVNGCWVPIPLDLPPHLCPQLLKSMWRLRGKHTKGPGFSAHGATWLPRKAGAILF